MKNFLKEIFSGTELVGTINLIGFLAVFFLIEAIWHYALTDYLRYIHKNQKKE
jgi:hypothetical protein